MEDTHVIWICQLQIRCLFICSLQSYGFSGKIACTNGHSSWISSKLSRQKVFDLRGRSDAIIVGGSTVRVDGIVPHGLFTVTLLHK